MAIYKRVLMVLEFLIRKELNSERDRQTVIYLGILTVLGGHFRHYGRAYWYMLDNAASW
jgi:hypothetical protein